MATVIEVEVTAGPPWPDTGTPDAFPIAIEIGGEQLLVRAATAPTAGRQRLTVTRGTNGLALPHTAGSAVQLARPALVAL
ncbi:hypothetical protein ABZS76_36990 [Streptomyces sp. NPDC005562]|uniref:hypothetical protein n=1 Tax=unclassified Streptomyces TaxID=2593676 RepID=UPI0033B4ACB3